MIRFGAAAKKERRNTADNMIGSRAGQGRESKRHSADKREKQTVALVQERAEQSRAEQSRWQAERRVIKGGAHLRAENF